MDVNVAIDCMGGDTGATVTVPAALRYLAEDPNSAVVLVGREAAIEAELARHHATPSSRLRVQHAAEVVEMDDPPATALRSKKDSSMRVAIDLVKSGGAQ